MPIRAALYTFSDNSFWLIGVQVLDRIGRGIFGALTPLVIADIMHWHGPLQPRPGRHRDDGRHRRLAERDRLGRDRRPFRLFRRVLTLGAAALQAAIVFGVAMPETAEFAKPAGEREAP